MSLRTACAFVAVAALAALSACANSKDAGGGSTSGGAVPAVGGAGSSAIGAVQASKGRPADDVFAKATTEHRWDDFEQMILVLGLKGEAEAAFRANMKDRGAKLDQFRASDLQKQADEAKKQLAAAKESKDEKKIAELTAKSQDLGKQVQAKMEDFRRIVMGAMSPAQQQHWAQYVCYRGQVTGLKGVELTAEQKDKVWALCAPAAAKLAAGNYVAKDPYLRGDDVAAAHKSIREDMVKNVLTEAQRKQLPAPAAAPAKK